jgi:hypothetical protein
MVTTELDAIRAAITEDKLFRRAVDDAMLALLQPLVGLTIPAAITALDRLREDLERARHDRPRATIRICIRPRRP